MRTRHMKISKMSSTTKMFFLVLLGIQIVSSFSYADLNSNKTPPVFADNYHVRGVLSLPYAELNEPFQAWYDKNLSRSRTDYYGDLYKVYQFGPRSAPEGSASQYGAIYKLAWVPVNLDTKSTEKESSGHTDTRRACFIVNGGVGFTVQPQSVLPDLSKFKYDSTGNCPTVNLEHKRHHCELWKSVTNVGEKRNVYKFWLRRDEKSGTVIPVHYYMLGYDSLLGSHFDRYDLTYYDFKASSATDADFKLEISDQQCGPMPGPGSDVTDAQKRSHIILQNPIHEFVTEPHRYDHIDEEFSKFASDHGKDFNNSHHERSSWHNFMHNFRFINSKNRLLKKYKLKVNKFADNNHKDLRYLRGRLHSKGYNGGLDYNAHHNLRDSNGKLKNKLPDSWDWTLRGAVTPVKDQAVCGSCWSFGTSGTIEGAYFVKTGKLIRLSQQQMVDCSWKYGNNGCDGGEDFRAYQYIMNAGGLSSEEDSGSYMGVDGRCHDRETPKTVKISGFYNVTRNDREALMHAIVNYGPVTIAIDASQPTFTFYSHGIYYDEKCSNSTDSLDHQVLAVGYAKIDGKFAWQVKNSWSTYWGNNGYIMISAENNNCGVMDSPTVPKIEV